MVHTLPDLENWLAGDLADVDVVGMDFAANIPIICIIVVVLAVLVVVTRPAWLSRRPIGVHRVGIVPIIDPGPDIAGGPLANAKVVDVQGLLDFDVARRGRMVNLTPIVEVQCRRVEVELAGRQPVSRVDIAVALDAVFPSPSQSHHGPCELPKVDFF